MAKKRTKYENMSLAQILPKKFNDFSSNFILLELHV